eukprot:TRINITY_DN48016_c0_g1_i1.p1 TRINITY_DN48016_c0_g1~~TRINITY_DN48016_c0_g1_i1.p1  ORF type:complete len:948 (+),score=143.45 TRINITY_DN48016_c0_g1_i1:41-2884(+)
MLVGQASDAVPLRSVHVEVVAIRSIARCTVRQTYVNAAPTTVEARYVFPLPESASVTHFDATFEGRHVVGVLKGRKEAVQIYEVACQRGARAAILEAERPDAFKASIGNIGAGEEVVVTLQYCQELPVSDGALRLAIPAHVAGRYAPGESLGSEDSKIFQSLAASHAVKKAAFSVHVTWETGGSEVDSLESPSHPSFLLERTDEKPGMVNARFAGATLETDLVVCMRPKELFQPVVHWEEWSKQGTQALMLHLVPKFELPMLQKAEVIFVVDCSGSMDGARMAQAKKALQICVQALPAGCLFNVIRFGRIFAAMSEHGSIPKNEANLRKAAMYIDNLRANMGGTEILQPLRFALETGKVPEGYERQIVLITDGKVSNEEHIIDYARSKCSQARIFPLGVGSGVSTFLVNGLARASQGHAAFVQDGEHLEPVCIAMLKKALTPAISLLSVSWPESLEDDFVFVDSPLNQAGACLVAPSATNGSELSFFDPERRDPKAFKPPPRIADMVVSGSTHQQAPRRPPPIFADSQFCAFALYPAGKIPNGTVKVTGETPFGNLSLELPLPAGPSRQERGIVHQMAARALIRDIEEERCSVNSDEALRLSLLFSVLCRSTAFVTVDESDGCEMSVPTDQVSIDRPLEKPAGKTATPAIRSREPRGFMSHMPRPPMAVSNAVSWRSEGIHYKKNEVFIDVRENMSLSVAVDGSVLKSKVDGVMRMRSCLSGMPEVKLGLSGKFPAMLAALGCKIAGFYHTNDAIEIASLHQCVRTSYNDHPVLSFVPPDGEFDLMRYCCDHVANAPLKVKTAISPGLDQMEVEYVVHLTSSLKAHVSTSRVEIRIPLFEDAAQPKFSSSKGCAQYLSEENVVLWHIQRIQGSEELDLTLTFKSPSAYSPWTPRRIPASIEVRFETPGFVASGATIRYLKVVEKSGYQASQRLQYLSMCESLHRLPF